MIAVVAALVEGVDPSDWMPAAITGGLALCAIVIQGRRTRKEVAQRVGQPNGQGNLTQMLERSIRWQGKSDERTERILTRLGRIEAGQRAQDARLDALEQTP